jgi:hypothetical protein
LVRDSLPGHQTDQSARQEFGGDLDTALFLGVSIASSRGDRHKGEPLPQRRQSDPNRVRTQAIRAGIGTATLPGQHAANLWVPEMLSPHATC